MFGTNWSDPQTLWLNLTNLALGIAALLAMAFVAIGIGRELVARRRRIREVQGIDAEIRHLLHVPELGLTMADGGEPMPPRKPAPEDAERK